MHSLSTFSGAVTIISAVTHLWIGPPVRAQRRSSTSTSSRPGQNPRFFKGWKQKEPFRRSSDRMLVYVKDDRGNYCLLAYLHDDAHTLLNKTSLVGHLADLAEEWFRENDSFPMR